MCELGYSLSLSKSNGSAQIFFTTLHGKNDFAERSKILLDIDISENNVVEPSK